MTSTTSISDDERVTTTADRNSDTPVSLGCVSAIVAVKEGERMGQKKRERDSGNRKKTTAETQSAA